MQIPPKEPFKRLTTSAMTHFSLTQSCIVAAFVCYLSSCRAAACTLLFMFAANYLPALLENWRHDREEADLLSRVAKRELLVGKWKANAEKASSSSLTVMRPPRYAPDDPELAAYLNVHGFVVVQAAADSSQVQKATGLLWEWLVEAAGWKCHEPGTWTDSSFRAIGDPTNGIVSGRGFGHSRLAWYVRTLPRVRRAFETIWKTSELIVSFDGGNIFRPYDSLAPRQCSTRTRGGWWHVDQGRTKRGLCAVQGFVSLTCSDERTGGLCVVPGSHHGHDELMSYAATNDNDYVTVPEPAVNPALQGAVLVACEAGDLVLWDSRTIHCNTPAILSADSAESSQKDNVKADLLRAVVYVCMTPARWASRKVLHERRLAFAAGIGSTHWPHEFRPIAFTEQAFLAVGEAGARRVLQEAETAVRSLVG